MDSDCSNPFIKEGQQHAQHPIQQQHPSWLRGWWFESLAVLTSIGCTVGIIVILIVVDDHLLNDWKLPYLSIPTTLSILTTASKSALAFAVSGAISQHKWLHFRNGSRRLIDFDLFDQASRGPYGSVFLLLKRPKVLANLGAIAILLSLAVDPSVQQIIDLNSGGVEKEDGRATFGLAHQYQGGSVSNAGQTGLLVVDRGFIDASMQAAIYKGLFGLDSGRLFNCPANCTWPDSYYSLGFSSTCLDVTEKTLQASNATYGALDAEGGNVTTPGGVRLNAVYSPTSFQSVVVINTTRLLNSTLEETTTLPDGGGSLSRHHITPDISRIAIFRVPQDLTNSYIATEDIEIIECDLSLVAYRYSDIKVENNTLVIGTQEVVRLGTGVVLKDDKNLPRGWDATFGPAGGVGPNMTVGVRDLVGLDYILSSNRFSGTIYSGESPPAPNEGIGDAFRSGNNMSAALDYMAGNMTEYLRSRDNVTAKAVGISIYLDTYVNVRWVWLVPTLVTQVISVVFFVVVVVKSSLAPGLHLWKDSTLAVLSQELRPGEEIVGDGYIVSPQVNKVSELEEWGETVRARLI